MRYYFEVVSENPSITATPATPASASASTFNKLVSSCECMDSSVMG